MFYYRYLFSSASQEFSNSQVHFHPFHWSASSHHFPAFPYQSVHFAVFNNLIIQWPHFFCVPISVWFSCCISILYPVSFLLLSRRRFDRIRLIFHKISLLYCKEVPFARYLVRILSFVVEFLLKVWVETVSNNVLFKRTPSFPAFFSGFYSRSVMLSVCFYSRFFMFDK